jgi:23S rRNA A2030 N6-methylase RlmJ
MSNQKKHAGNIGDMIKHALLTELMIDFAESNPERPIRYLETHAGFYDYEEKALKKPKGGWKGQRAWSLGIVVQAIEEGRDLGRFGEILGKSIKADKFTYPGSLKLIDEVLKPLPRRVGGFDTGTEQVQSFPPEFEVKEGDGYTGVTEILRAMNPSESCAVFVDPFWTGNGSGEISLVEDLAREAGEKAAVVVWYPLKKDHHVWRKSLEKEDFRQIEMRYRDTSGGWAGQDLKGAGMAYRGFRDETSKRLRQQAERLKSIFEGKKHTSTRLLDLMVVN